MELKVIYVFLSMKSEMFEYEFRISVTLPDLNSIKNILKNFKYTSHIVTYTVKYIKHFDRKENHPWELKKQLRKIMVHHVPSSSWLKFVESKEVPFNQWKRANYIQFKQHIAFQQNLLDVEYRYEVKLDKNAKLYCYNKNFIEFGVVFELEIFEVDSRCKELSIVMNNLDPYSDILNLFHKKTFPPYTLHKCVRIPVVSTDKEIKNCLKAVKHDGRFGHVYSYGTSLKNGRIINNFYFGMKL